MKLYKPNELAKLDIIRNWKNTNSDKININSNYQFILGLIRNGDLKAVNYGKGARAYWVVTEKEVQRYLKNKLGK